MGQLMIEPMLICDSADSKIELVVVYLGTSDAAVPENKLQHVNVDRYKENLLYIGSKVQNHGARLVLAGPGIYSHVTTEKQQSDPTNERGYTFLKYVNGCKEAAAQLQVPFIDQFHAHLDFLGWTDSHYLKRKIPDGLDKMMRLLVDKVHFTGEANRIYYKKVVETIKIHYTGLDAANIVRCCSLYEPLIRIT